MRVVFDTNILVLYFLGDPAESIIRAALSSQPEQRELEPLDFFYSEATFVEYESVFDELHGEKPVLFSEERISFLLDLYRKRGHVVYPTTHLDVCPHEPDNRFVECAVAANANYILTVNLRHFPTSYQGIEVLPPGEFYRRFFD